MRCARFVPPDDAFVLTACDDRVARLWDKDGNIVTEFRGHEGAVMWVDVSHDGKTILTVSRDGTARLWNRDGQVLSRLEGHEGVVWRGAFSPRGDRVITASWDRTARVWIVDPNELIREAESRVIRSFTDTERVRYGELLGEPTAGVR